MELYIDIGNTTVGCAIYYKNEFKMVASLSSVTLSNVAQVTETITEGLNKWDFGWSKIKLIVLSSVRPLWDATINQLAQSLNKPLYQVKKNLTINLANFDEYQQKQMGSDLLISLYAFQKKYAQQDGIIVDLGTATTIMAIKKTKLLGVVIMPGLALSAQGLFHQAQLLNNLHNYQWENKILGNNTQEAINLGVVNSHYYAIKGHLTNIQPLLHQPKLIVLGGNAQYILPNLVKDGFSYERMLIFLGLRYALLDQKLLLEKEF